MKILLDECIDRRLANEIEGHEVVTVPQAGWAGIQNGELLRLAQAQFDVFVTVDRNLSFQQHLPQFAIAVIVLQASTNRLKDLRPLVPPTPTKAFGRSKRPGDVGEPVACYHETKSFYCSERLLRARGIAWLPPGLVRVPR